MTGTGASAPVIMSAAARTWAEERRGCRIARSPGFQALIVSAGFSPLYGKKKRGFGCASAMRPRARLRGIPALRAAMGLAPQGISLKAQEKKRLGPRGECGPSRQSHDERAHDNLQQRYAEGVSLTPTHISVACYSSMTRGPVVDDVRAPTSCWGSIAARSEIDAPTRAAVFRCVSKHEIARPSLRDVRVGLCGTLAHAPSGRTDPACVLVRRGTAAVSRYPSNCSSDSHDCERLPAAVLTLRPQTMLLMRSGVAFR